MTDKSSDEIFADAIERMRAADLNTQIRLLAERMSQIASDTAVHGERDKAISDRLGKLEQTLSEVSVKVDSIDDMANRWRGAFILLMGIGGAGGVVMAFWDRFSKWVHP